MTDTTTATKPPFPTLVERTEDYHIEATESLVERTLRTLKNNDLFAVFDSQGNFAGGALGPDGLFYKRYLLSHRGAIINAFDIGYPEALKAEYDPIVTRMSKSLKPGRGYQIKGVP